MSDSKSRVHINGEQKGRAPVADYNEVNLLETDDAKQAKLEFWTAKQIGEHLVKVYPNRQWGVDVDIDNGMVIITCPSVSTQYGYHLHFKSRAIHELQMLAQKAAGEILERYGVTRSRIVDPNSFDHMPQDSRGNVISSDAVPDNGKRH